MCYRTSLFEVHKIHIYSIIFECKCGEKWLVGTGCRDSEQFVLGVTFVFVFEVDGVGWLRNSLRQVPDLEVFSLVNRKELTDPSCKASSVISKVLRPFKLFPCPFIFLNFCIIKIKKTPFYLCYCIFGLLVPNCNGRCKIFVEDTIEKLFIMFEKLTLSNHMNMHIVNILYQT